MHAPPPHSPCCRYDDEDFEKESPRPEYDDDGFESEPEAAPNFSPGRTAQSLKNGLNDTLMNTQNILAKSMLQPGPIASSRAPLPSLDAPAVSLLLAYLGFARYSQLFLDAGVSGMDLASSDEDDFEVSRGRSHTRTERLQQRR